MNFTNCSTLNGSAANCSENSWDDGPAESFGNFSTDDASTAVAVVFSVAATVLLVPFQLGDDAIKRFYFATDEEAK
jgi:hypothetical protein